MHIFDKMFYENLNLMSVVDTKLQKLISNSSFPTSKTLKQLKNVKKIKKIYGN